MFQASFLPGRSAASGDWSYFYGVGKSGLNVAGHGQYVHFKQDLAPDRKPGLGAAVNEWFTARPARPEETPETDWLRFEQEKHERLLTHRTR